MSRQGAGRPTFSTAIRFPPELHERLREAADDRDVSINWLVVRACEDFLPRLLPADEIVWTRPIQVEAPPIDLEAVTTQIGEATELPLTIPQGPRGDLLMEALLLTRCAGWDEDINTLNLVVDNPATRATAHEVARDRHLGSPEMLERLRLARQRLGAAGVETAPDTMQERCWLACGDDARPCQLVPHHEGPCRP